MGFVIRRPDGSQRRVSGYKAAKKRLGAARYDASRTSGVALPPRVDLRPFMTSIENQGETNSCVANAVAGAYEYLVKKHLGDEGYDVSRLFIYYNGRLSDEDDPIEDEGTTISGAIEGLKSYGACAEETWPFEDDSVNEEPPAEAYSEGEGFLVEAVESVPTEIDAWKRCLTEGYPIIFALSLYDSFDHQRRAGMVPMPSSRESAREEHSGHAMLCVGYSDRDQLFIVRNSWGEEWGDDGYCYIPYRYVMSDELNGDDSWIIKRLDHVPDAGEAWGDDESVITPLDHEIANMSDEDYSALTDAMGAYHLEARIALLFLHVAKADGTVSRGEGREIHKYLGELLSAMGSRQKPERLLLRAGQDMRSDALLEETIALFAEHLPKGVLAGILSKLEEVAGSDELAAAEETFLNELIEAWQVEASASDEEEEGDEEEESAEEEGDEEDEEGDEEDDEEEEGEDEDEDEEEDDEDEEESEDEDE